MSGTRALKGGIESDALQAGVAEIYPADVWPLPGVEGDGPLTPGVINMRVRRVSASGSFQVTKRG